jgi:hypothetical protein
MNIFSAFLGDRQGKIKSTVPRDGGQLPGAGPSVNDHPIAAALDAALAEAKPSQPCFRFF